MALGPTFFPALNAFLNGSSAVLIGTGYYFIKTGRRQAHKRMMIAAVITSALFLISYLYYHLVLRAVARGAVARCPDSPARRRRHFVANRAVPALHFPFWVFGLVTRGGYFRN